MATVTINFKWNICLSLGPRRGCFEYGRIIKNLFNTADFWRSILSKLDLYGIQFTVVNANTEDVEMYEDHYIYITRLTLFTTLYPTENSMESKEEKPNNISSRMKKFNMDACLKKRFNKVFFNRIILDTIFKNEARVFIIPTWFIKIESSNPLKK